MTPAPNSAVLDSPEAAQAGTQIVDADVTASPELVLEELLVEEISIDGMCGVY
jgi:mycofactocin precursor